MLKKRLFGISAEQVEAALVSQEGDLKALDLAIEAEEKGVKLKQATRAERNKTSLEAARMLQSAQKPKKES